MFFNRMAPKGNENVTNKAQDGTRNAFLDQKKILLNIDVRVIFDVGANIGQTTKKYCKLFPTAQIFSFEPFEEAYSTLALKHQANSSVKPVKLAISDHIGTDQLNLNVSNETNSLLKVACGSDRYVDKGLTENIGSVDVDTISIDEYCKNECIENIQILKLDIQGTELMALRGAENLLKDHLIDLIYTEVLFAELYTGQAYFADICRYLEGHGYILYGLYDLTHGENGVLAWGDAIFISPKLKLSLNGECG